ncbi:FAD-dependent monooxygenase [Bradyrhizobium jicamae]|uniref:FAD-dependent monooxygenase n=1 Tax=Bradyrhizobium jicamae TaxID=280332 RepID=UPI001BA759D7|nr:FAD-dependent monooxygenase [Bradyrhizobium jicamae]MBR0931923.1 FAD-dependent monooxygenase [Bradyrhizobium jicamae]
MREHSVVIAGGGPTGLMLAGELALAGVDVAIVERRASQDVIGSRALGLHIRSIEVFDQRGIADRFISQGQRHPAVHFQIALAVGDLPTRHNYTLGLLQNHIERILSEWVGELGVPIHRGRQVTGFTQNETGVDILLSDGASLRAEYLVGCDGGRSLVRKLAGIAFPGCDPTMSWLIAEAEMAEEPKWGFHENQFGTHAIGKAGDGKSARIVLAEPQLQLDTNPTLRDVSETMVAAYGTDFGIHSPVWISRFTDMTRQAETYRDRRVLLAGDAAHVHPPMGGQGLNLGVQDAVNLGWKLAQVIQLTSPDSLLDTYHAERHPVAARVLHNTLAQSVLRRTDPRTRALGDIVSEFLRMDEPRRRVAAMMSGLDIHYDLGDGHPLLGRRMPDLGLLTAEGPRRVFSLLHQARALLLNFGEPGGVEIAPWADRVQSIDAGCRGAWELPVIGKVAAPTAALVRPDGYVAWVGEAGEQPGLTEALIKWFGAPAATRQA